ncbi:hypothetical protein DICPUDRAFT_45589 [Dictyostelium purpureum]|uniref:Pseudouridine synthase I TruA alpha/beta domain-containing protein n=1 Tax=Dictyostelium purpureum TaxID=5786 RepID=F0ZAZ5_DICPU|nr:uncharacterized protein DICPUDRAFT_45589 [Dictyostelium purpureum]EGC38915.1 hypothetical protein DICPUDRAFT_45589 [Dictyostelium purpureum]|eukprot:XP_003284595.1 hypothetical protein DICPUDRAFT_45589 [Dictyostelium purpureum]
MEEDEEVDEEELDKRNQNQGEEILLTSQVVHGPTAKKGSHDRPQKLSKEQLTEIQNKTKLTTEASRKKKVAVLLGYLGKNYAGMQKNPGLRTIEEELEMAIFKAGGILPDNLYFQHKIDWVRCARTDKGVSALRNVVSLKMEVGPPELDEMVKALNKLLPEDIHVFKIMRVNNSFHAKNGVDARSYVYVCPTSAFEPKFATNKLVEPFKFTEETRETLNRVLSYYLGNHRFHNYTSRKESNDVSVFRKIIKFECSVPFILEGVEMVSINVIGESFMLHQIRKMIGCLMSFMRKGIFQDAQDKESAFDQIRKYIEATFYHQPLNLPVAPGAGLLLDHCIFRMWNEKYKDIHGELMVENDDVEQFRKVVFGEIASLEATKREFSEWIETKLDPHPLPYEILHKIIENPPPAPPKRPKQRDDKKFTRRERKEHMTNIKKFDKDTGNNEEKKDQDNTTEPSKEIKEQPKEETNASEN